MIGTTIPIWSIAVGGLPAEQEETILLNTWDCLLIKTSHRRWSWGNPQCGNFELYSLQAVTSKMVKVSYGNREAKENMNLGFWFRTLTIQSDCPWAYNRVCLSFHSTNGSFVFQLAREVFTYHQSSIKSIKLYLEHTSRTQLWTPLPTKLNDLHHLFPHLCNTF